MLNAQIETNQCLSFYLMTSDSESDIQSMSLHIEFVFSEGLMGQTRISVGRDCWSPEDGKDGLLFAALPTRKVALFLADMMDRAREWNHDFQYSSTVELIETWDGDGDGEGDAKRNKLKLVSCRGKVSIEIESPVTLKMSVSRPMLSAAAHFIRLTEGA